MAVEFDLAARDFLLVYFFTTIGINSSVKDLLIGGHGTAIVLGPADCGTPRRIQRHGHRCRLCDLRPDSGEPHGWSDRQVLDRPSQSYPRQRRYVGRGNFGGEFSRGDSGYSDFFEAMFGHGARQAAYQQKGADVDTSISISLEEAYTGTNRTITFKTPEISQTGTVEHKKKTLNVMIPKGIKKGGRIRLKGHGGPGNNGGEAGDMYIRIDIDRHKLFKVEGADVYLTLPVAPWEAALGGQINVPSPAGTINLNIPKGSESGNKLRVKGKGIPASQPGNLYVILQIVLPPADNEKAKKLYEEMSKLNFHPRHHMGV